MQFFDLFSVVPSFWLELDNINQFIKQNKNLFPTVKMAFTCLPSFPNGQASFVLCSLNHVSMIAGSL